MTGDRIKRRFLGNGSDSGGCPGELQREGNWQCRQKQRPTSRTVPLRERERERNRSSYSHIDSNNRKKKKKSQKK